MWKKSERQKNAISFKYFWKLPITDRRRWKNRDEVRREKTANIPKQLRRQNLEIHLHKNNKSTPTKNETREPRKEKKTKSKQKYGWGGWVYVFECVENESKSYNNKMSLPVFQMQQHKPNDFS